MEELGWDDDDDDDGGGWMEEDEWMEEGLMEAGCKEEGWFGEE